MVSVISNVLIYGLGWMVGIITDSCIRKTRILFITALLMYAGYVITIVLSFHISLHRAHIPATLHEYPRGVNFPGSLI